MAALKEMSSVFNDLGIEVKIVGIGKQAMQGCIACGWCERMGRCTFHDNVYDELFDLMKEGVLMRLCLHRQSILVDPMAPSVH